MQALLLHSNGANDYFEAPVFGKPQLPRVRELVCIARLGYAAAAHRHRRVDDIIFGGIIKYVDGHMWVPTGLGLRLGVTLARNKFAEFHELFKQLGGHPYDRNPSRPSCYPLRPNTRWES